MQLFARNVVLDYLRLLSPDGLNKNPAASKEMRFMYCLYCGSTIANDAQFCESCGKKQNVVDCIACST